MWDRIVSVPDHCLSFYSALNNLISGINGHRMWKITYNVTDNGHCVKVDTSPHIEGGKYLANLRIIHGVKCSGLRYIQYERFWKAAGLGICSETCFLTWKIFTVKRQKIQPKSLLKMHWTWKLGKPLQMFRIHQNFFGNWYYHRCKIRNTHKKK